MKKTLFLITLFVAVYAASFAAVTSVTIDWSNVVTGLTGDISCGTYNFATGHFLVTDYSVKQVRIASGTDGSLTGGTLNNSTITFNSADTLGIFGICATTDGVIYGGVNNKTNGDTGGVSLIRWANEGAVPTQQDPAPSGTMYMQFPRAMDAVGTGVDTLIGVTGDSANYNVTFLTTTDGTTFAVTDYTPVKTSSDTDYEKFWFKQGVAVVAGNQKVYGLKADGAGILCKLVKSGTEWGVDAGFTNPTLSSDLSIIGYAPNLDAIFSASRTDDKLRVYDGSTGAETVTGGVALGQDLATYGYGAIDLDETAGVGYFVGRQTATGSLKYICGKFSYPAYVPPTATPTETPSPIPTATPVANVTSSWGLYE